MKNEMTTLKRDNETTTVENWKVELYKSCGWESVTEMFSYSSKEEQEQAWMERFGD
jgi:hypothetical protein